MKPIKIILNIIFSIVALFLLLLYSPILVFLIYLRKRIKQGKKHISFSEFPPEMFPSFNYQFAKLPDEFNKSIEEQEKQIIIEYSEITKKHNFLIEYTLQ